MIIWDRLAEYVVWARASRIPRLFLRCLGAWVVAITVAFVLGTAFAAFLRGFFWLFHVW